MSIALTGATGALGSLVVDALLTRGTPASDIVALVRDADRAKALADLGVGVRVAPYGDVPALARALDGVDRLLLISGPESGERVSLHGSVVTAAQQAGVGFIAYTSAPHADDTVLLVAPDHAATENLIRASGLAYSILRNNWYHENYGAHLKNAEATGKLFSSAGTGRVASASRADYAQAAAIVLAGGDHDGRVYELSGDVAWTFADLASVMGEVLGRPVELVPLDRESHTAALTAAGIDPRFVGFLTQLDADIAEGALAEATADLSRLIGRPTTPLIEGLRQLR
ncbi:SDR family oxidoreductase [Kineosporia sp. NBRC 101731]|uniref:SDR family oxidoreductase n=1 Tax=Kineosporia sp. NBRC 101731 TaxID=3032199 RepID=UPI0024A29C47|nr:SDR family oxidoreductase [Kineosporia sp. NBRC 101731]GLY26807.1 NAD(P)-dependent oxidoreductase [Kineosporia sp. NBRC 101731]